MSQLFNVPRQLLLTIFIYFRVAIFLGECSNNTHLQRGNGHHSLGVMHPGVKSVNTTMKWCYGELEAETKHQPKPRNGHVPSTCE